MTHKPHSPRWILPLFACLSASIAQGEQNPFDLEEMVVTATRTEQNIRDVPAAVTLIGREEIERSSAVTVDQLLQGVPGVYAARMDPSSPNRIAQTYTRGLPGNSRTLVLLDGIPMNVLYDGQVDWSQLATQDVERVEVVRGAGSGLYGANAMGGVINILSRAPEPGIRTRIGADYGSLNSRRLSAAHSQSHGLTAFSLSASRFESDGYNMWRPDASVPPAHRDAIGTVKDNLNAKLVQGIDANQFLEASLSYLRDEATGFYKPGVDGYTPQTREQFVPSLRYTREDDNSETQLVTYARIGHQWADTLSPVNYASLSERGEYQDRSLGLNAQHSRHIGAGQRLTLGLDYLNGEIDNHYSYPGTPRLRETLGDLQRYGLFAQDEIALGTDWRLNIAGRYDHWKTGGNQTDTGTGQPNSNYKSRSDGQFSPKLGLLYKATDNLNLRVSAGQAFNLPDMFNLYANTKRGATTYWANPELEPEKVNAYDIGIDYYFGQDGYVKLTAYRNDATDLIYSVQRDASNVDKRNVGAVKTEGLEFEARYRAYRNLLLSASYTLNNSVIVENENNRKLEGKQLVNVPRHQAHLRADWFLSPARLYLTVNHVGDRYGNDANTTTYRAYTTVDLGGAYAFTQAVEARLTFANLTNEKYEGIGYIAPGATVTASLQARF
ncbi:MAG: TonB-dependent receptor [Halothiobacillaceae bacterium]|nr:TonB-dependent receptor [Halothiobacillaceae bacterium]MDY0049184.1 TonB-dependent receptor [Halothiobacillaceae bacterium]